MIRKASGLKHEIPLRCFPWVLSIPLFLGSVPWAHAQESPKEQIIHGSAVVAVVNGKPITFGEVWERVHRVLEEARTQGSDEQFQKYARDLLEMGRQDLIGRQLLLAKAEEEGIKITDRHIERYAEREMEVLNRDQGANLTSLEDFFEARTQQTGLSEKKYREEIRAKVLISQLLASDVWQPEYFSPEVVRSFYREYRSDFRAGGYVAVRHVYVRREQPDYARIVEGIKSAVDAGSDFEGIARDAVTGGLSRRQGRDGAGRYHYRLHNEEQAGGQKEAEDGFVGDLLQPLPRLILSLGAGEVSQPLQTPQGTHFVKVIERAGGRVRTFDEVQLVIQRKLSMQLEDQTKLDYINNLVNNAEIRRLPFPVKTPLGEIPPKPAAGPRKPPEQSPGTPTDPPTPAGQEPPETDGRE